MNATVLQLEVGQSLQLGTDISVKIVGINRNKVRLEIEVPNTMSVLRGEIAFALARRLSEEEAARMQLDS